MRRDIPTMGELFQRNGYRCGHVGKWHLGDDADGTGPLSRGFDVNIAGVGQERLILTIIVTSGGQ